MLTLIKREIEDNRMFFIAAAGLAVIFGVLLVCRQVYHEEKYYKDIILGLGAVILIPVTIGFYAMGAAQMYWDRMKKVSALLATLAVTRNQIFTARVIAGFLLVIIGFIPLAVTIIAWLSGYGVVKTPVREGLYFEMVIPVFLFEVACYCIGLQAGWTSNKAVPVLGAMGLGLLFLTVIIIKGLAWEVYAIPVLIIAVCLMRAWNKFSRAAL
ncbi:MAG: hypothetical protein ABSB91_09065 [Sedimentisphaerales bacterium]|jgi:hypothetical protein